MQKYILLLILISSSVLAQDNELLQNEDVPEKICFSQSQIQRGVKQMEIGKDEQKSTALLLTNPLRSETVDCSSNMFAYPFLREANRDKPTTDGVWFNGETADLTLQLNWTKTTLQNAKPYDILVWRDTGEIAQLASINQIVVVDERRVMVETTIKPNSTPVLRYSFEVPSDLPQDVEVWQRIR